MAPPVATIFGGAGFIGRYIVQRLAQRGWILRIALGQPLDDVAADETRPAEDCRNRWRHASLPCNRGRDTPGQKRLQLAPRPHLRSPTCPLTLAAG